METSFLNFVGHFVGVFVGDFVGVRPKFRWPFRWGFRWGFRWRVHFVGDMVRISLGIWWDFVGRIGALSMVPVLPL